ncbi:MAG: GAF domain-containing protein [Anaerolineales bacterium]
MKDERKTKRELIRELRELRRRVKGLEGSGIAPTRGEKAPERLRDELKAVFDATPIPLIVIDQDRRIQRSNDAAQGFCELSEAEMIGKPYGEALHCLHYMDVPEGCGFGPVCQTCAVRTHVLDVFRAQQGAVGIETTLAMHIGREYLQRDIHISSAYFESESEPRVAVVMEDITERKQAEEALRVQADRLEHLRNISQSILEATSTDEIIQTALEELRTIVPCDRASIAKVDTEAQLAHVLAVNVNGETKFPRGSSIPLEAFGISDALLQGEAELIEDVETLDPTSPMVGPPRAEGLRSYIKSPLIVQGELFGTLNLGATEPRAFDREQCDIAREVTDLLSVALQQASLFESAHQRTRELNRSNALITSLGGVAARLQSDLNAEQLLETLGDELRKLDLASVVALFEPNSQIAYLRYFSTKPSVLSKIEKVVGFSLRSFRLDSSRHPLFLDLQENRQARFAPSLLEVAITAFPKLQKRLARQALRLADASPDTPSIFLPLVTEERFAGVLTVWGEDLHENDMPAFQALANQVAIALENAHLFEQVRTGRERLQFLARRLVKIQESERRHVAGELHDEIGQMLTGLRFTLERCRQLPREQANAKLKEAEELTRELMSRLREISLDLHPSMLDDMGLVPALIWQFDRFTTQTGVRVDFEHSGMGSRLPSDLETAAYRITQEALTNVARHTGADEVTVQIDEEGSRLSLRIEDQGPGFDPESLKDARNRVGLTGMYERAVALGGRFAIRSSEGEGTRILAELPVHERLERRGNVRAS